jgi:DNA-binding transcriptional ArsR family regulator
MNTVIDVEVIEDGAAAAAALDPIRSRLLDELREPGSAAELARRVGLARQKVNYHLRALEAHGLVEVAEERRHGGLTERVLQATAASYVIVPIGDPMRAADRLSARYLIALAARIVREVGALTRRDERLPTLALDTEIRVKDRAAFADELTRAVTQVIANHHTTEGEPYRLLVAAYPKEDA